MPLSPLLFSVSNADSTLTISPTTGDVIASLNLSKANNWIGQQNFAASVGIGTTSPTALLNVSKGVALTPTSLTAANSYLHFGGLDYGASSPAYTAIAFGFTNGAANTNAPAYLSYVETSTAANTKGDLAFYTRDVTTDTAPTERLRIDSAGNLGLGTATINSTAGGTRIFEISGTVPTIRFDETDNVTDYEIFANAGKFNVWDGTAERITISSGLVGINTTIPAAMFQVDDELIQANPTSTTAIINSEIGTANSTGNYETLVLSNGGTDPTTSIMGPALSFKAATYGTTTTYSSGRILSYFDTSGGSNPGFTGGILALQYPTADNTFTTGLLLRAGRVCIGTTSNSATTTMLRVQNSADSAGNVLFAGLTMGIRFGSDTTGNFIEGVNATGFSSYQPLTINGTTVALGTSGTTRLTVAAAAITPTVSITSTVDASAIISRTGASTNYQFIRIDNTGASAYWGVESSVAGAFFTGSLAYSAVNYTTNANIQFLPAGTKALTALTTGLVGIGTTGPAMALEVNHATGQNLRLTYNDSDGSAVVYTDFTLSAAGDLTIAPTGGDVLVTGAVRIPDSPTGIFYAGTGFDLRIYHDGSNSYIQNTTGDLIFYQDSATDVITFSLNATNTHRFTTSAYSPSTNDLVALGTTSLGFSDLHLATGGVINWANGEATLTETDANTLTVAGANFTAPYFLRSVGNALTAAGTTRTDALQLAKEINNVTTAAAGTGVILPVGIVGMRITVFNAGANAIQVYASASETIDTVAGATGVPLTNAKRCEYFFVAANTWISSQLGVISA